METMSPEKMLYHDKSATIEKRVGNLLSQMTLAEKVGQMTQVEKNSIHYEDVTKYFIGSILSGGGGSPATNNVQEWRKMVQNYINASLETRLGIPAIYGVDAVHGHNNVYGATIFPHNVGLGASRDADLVERIARATASEIMATNVHWDFAPAVSVPQDIRWGRTYEGFSENTDLVTELGVAYVRGMEQEFDNGERALASVKHFAGDGGAEWASTIIPEADDNWQAAGTNWLIDRGDCKLDEETFRKVHLAPYKATIEAGAKNIMVSFSSWKGLRMHAHHYLLTEVLKNEWGFDGFLVSDWMALVYLSDDAYEAIVIAINAGLDMIMVPYDYKSFITHLTGAVEKGDVSLERIDDAVTRILKVKFMLGLFEKPLSDETFLADFGGESHRALAREAVQKSLVLLKHENDILPFRPGQKIALAGQAGDDIGYACGGWTIDWQGGSGAITKGATLLDGLRSGLDEQIIYSPVGQFGGHVDIGIVIVAEKPTAEGDGDSEDLTLSAEDTALIEAVRTQCDKLLLIIYSGRPIIITHVLDHCDAIVAAWLPGSEANAIADVLIGDVPFTGKLSYTWVKSMDQIPASKLQATDESPLWEFGFGLSL